MNLREEVIKGLQQSLRYIYDAAGRKISQEVYNGTGLIVKKSDYEGEFFYQNDTLKFMNHEEGRVVMTGAGPEYQYNLKDHLGNVRLTFTTKPDSEENLATLETANAAITSLVSILLIAVMIFGSRVIINLETRIGIISINRLGHLGKPHL